MVYLRQMLSSLEVPALLAGLVALHMVTLAPAAVRAGVIYKAAETYQSRDLFPMKPGLTWVYQLRTHVTNRPVSVDRLEIVARGPMRFGPLGRNIFVLDEVIGGHPDPTGYYFDKNELIKVLGLTYTKQNELIWLELPTGPALPAPYRAAKNLEFFLPETLKLHTSWKASFYVTGALVDTQYEMTGIETVQVDPLKNGKGEKRSAARIESIMKMRPAFGAASGPGSVLPPQDSGPAVYKFVEWYSPGVGLIRSVATGPGKDDSSELDLIDFTERQTEGANHSNKHTR